MQIAMSRFYTDSLGFDAEFMGRAWLPRRCRAVLAVYSSSCSLGTARLEPLSIAAPSASLQRPLSAPGGSAVGTQLPAPAWQPSQSQQRQHVYAGLAQLPLCAAAMASAAVQRRQLAVTPGPAQLPATMAAPALQLQPAAVAGTQASATSGRRAVRQCTVAGVGAKAGTPTGLPKGVHSPGASCSWRHQGAAPHTPGVQGASCGCPSTANLVRSGRGMPAEDKLAGGYELLGLPRSGPTIAMSLSAAWCLHCAARERNQARTLSLSGDRLDDCLCLRGRAQRSIEVWVRDAPFETIMGRGPCLPRGRRIIIAPDDLYLHSMQQRTCHRKKHVMPYCMSTTAAVTRQTACCLLESR